MSKRFVRSLDLAERIYNALGGNIGEQIVYAVDNVDLAIAPREVVALVGESGCGKSTLGRIFAGALKPTSGSVLYRGNDISRKRASARRRTRQRVQMIFQNPFASLNPRMRIRDIIGEAPRLHRIAAKAELDDYVDNMLRRCGLDARFKNRYPHELSGGQRQRVGIARALAVQPEALVCDEAVAALDVSVQAQIINLFMKLRAELGLAYLFISHDLGVVKHLSDRVAIMYLGRIVEMANTGELFDSPNHPYTQALLAEMPQITRRRLTFSAVRGEIPSPLNPPTGCHFHPRCPRAFTKCSVEQPALRTIAPGRLSACHLNDLR